MFMQLVIRDGFLQAMTACSDDEICDILKDVEKDFFAISKT